MIKQAEITRQFKVEVDPKLRVMASGIKFTDAALTATGLEPEKSGVHFGQDEKGKLFICASEVAGKIQKNKTFRNSGLQTALLGLAAGAEILDKDDKPTGQKIAKNTEVKEGLQVAFTVSTTPVVEDGVNYFEVTFEGARFAEVKRATKADVTETSKPVDTASLAAATTGLAPVTVDEDENNF